MINVSGRMRMFAGGWILAALIVIAYNGASISTLFSPPIVGLSKDARLASQKWLRLENKMTTRAKRSVAPVDLNQVVARYTPKISPATIKTAAPTADVAKKTATPVVPPVLTGIIEVMDRQGARRLTALMEGRRGVEKERIRGFSIKKITLDGVELTRNGHKWFIPAPKVYFVPDRSG